MKVLTPVGVAAGDVLIHSAASNVEPAVTRAIKNVVDETKGHNARTPQRRERRRAAENGPKRT